MDSRISTFVLIGLLLAGCGRDSATTPPTQTAKKATIKADPNPAAPIVGKFGKTTITWDTGNGSPGNVYLSHEGGTEKPFALNRPKGSQEATWIGKGVYEFRLYGETERTTPLASVKVTRSQK